MKLFITGGAGFIGSNFIRYYLQNHPGDSIINFDVLSYAGNVNNLVDIEDSPQYSFIHGDITDFQAVMSAMKTCDIVVHFAAESHVDRSIVDPSPFVKTNVLGTQVLLDVALKLGVKRFHHVSTDEVFGTLAINGDDKFIEDTPYDPHSPYSASKAGSDHLVRAYHDTFGLPITITNCSNNYGPYQFPEKFIPVAIINLLTGKKVPIYGEGKNIRDWLYVEDHCRAIDLVLTKGKIGETYCVGGLTSDIDNITVVRKIIGILGKNSSDFVFVPDRKGHDLRYSVSWKKLHDELGWSPQHDFDTYLNDTVNWYKKNVQWWQNILSGKYKQDNELRIRTNI